MRLRAKSLESALAAQFPSGIIFNAPLSLVKQFQSTITVDDRELDLSHVMKEAGIGVLVPYGQRVLLTIFGNNIYLADALSRADVIPVLEEILADGNILLLKLKGQFYEPSLEDSVQSLGFSLTKGGSL